MFFCFKYVPSNFEKKIEFSYHLINGQRLLSVVVEVIIFSAGKSLDLHDITFSVLHNLFNV